MILMDAPLQGLHWAEVALDRTAARVASLPASVEADPGPDTVDLSTEMVALLKARHSFAANIRVLKTADQITRKALDLLA